MKITLFSDKQLEAYQQSDARINIFEGPVRAGKSFIALVRWLEFCRSGPPGPLIICGRTDKTIKRNIINPLQDLVGKDVKYSIGKGEVQMFDRVMYVIGANDDRAEAKIRGSEFAGALIDELTILPENFVKMLLSRLSIPGASLFASTNPDSPFHWVKSDFIDRTADINCKVFSFNIEDNPSLGAKYIEDLKNEYQGLWYQRYIEGKWVMAEGTVYDFFDEKINCILLPPAQANYYIVGVDYGTTNPCVFVLIGYNPSVYPNMWLEKEYVYDSRKTQRQKSDYEYAMDLIEFIDGYNVEAIYIDPSAASFKQELRRHEVRNVRDAVNDVLPGIRFQGQLLTNGTYKVCSSCIETIKEYTNYVWDTKASQRGEDKPIKQNDHCFSGDTEVLTGNGYVPISEIRKNDLVITPYGIDRVIGTWESIDKQEVIDLYIDGKKIVCTPSHKFITEKGNVEAFNLTQKDILCRMYINKEASWKLKLSSGKEKSLDDTQKIKIQALGYILDAQEDSCTRTYGSTITEQYQEDTTYITKTETDPTTPLKIYNVCHHLNTLHCTEVTLQKLKKIIETILCQRCKKKQKNGTQVKQAYSGIESMLKKHGLQLRECFLVKVAVKNTSRHRGQEANIVPIHANLNIEETTEKIWKKESVQYARMNTNIIVLKSQSPAQCLVVQSTDGRKEKVYNLTTEKFNCYVVSGVTVSNCKDAERYALFSHFFERTGNKMTEEDADRLERAFTWKR